MNRPTSRGELAAMVPITEDEIVERIVQLFNKAELDTEAVMRILIYLLGSVLTSISCNECRRLTTTQLTEKIIPVLVDLAMSGPGETSHHSH